MNQSETPKQRKTSFFKTKMVKHEEYNGEASINTAEKLVELDAGEEDENETPSKKRKIKK